MADDIVEIEFEVEPNYAGWRLDKYLCEKIRRLSRTRIQEIIENDVISDRRLKASTLVSAGLKFRLRKKVLPEPSVPSVDAIEELYLDDDLLVINKPAGLPIHPTARYHHNTLVGQLKQKYGPDFRADPAHRLDRETSGVMICGRTTEVSRKLMRSFMSGDVKKEYFAICEGQPPADQFEVDAPISEGTEHIRIAVRIDPIDGKPSQTKFEVLKRFTKDQSSFATLRCLPQTGRQHQIRIHLKHLGFPLVGDKMYGPSEQIFDRFAKGILEPEDWKQLRLKRHALHAIELSLTHPRLGKRMIFEAPLPADLKDFIQ